MIEVIIKKYLEKNLKEKIYLIEPPLDFKNFVLIEKIGGDIKNHIKKSIIAVKSYGSSLQAAALLNEKVKENMLNMIEKDEIMSVNLSSDYNFTDTNTKRYRYQAVFEIIH